MAYTQAQLDATQEAYASGSLRVKYSDKEVTYRSLDEMERIIHTMKLELGQASETRRKFGAFNKGLG